MDARMISFLLTTFILPYWLVFSDGLIQKRGNYFELELTYA